MQVGAACADAKRYLKNEMRFGGHEKWRCDSQDILGVQPTALEQSRSAFNSLDHKFKEQLSTCVRILPSATQVDLRFLLFRLETSGVSSAF